jgi:hypothetical protein
MLDRIDEGIAIETQYPQTEGCLPQTSNIMETTMQKTALTIFGALLISGLAVQMAAASEHHRSKAYFGRDLSELRGAYNQVSGPINVTPRALDRFDPSWQGGNDPSLNPSGS